jgi:hypothetical protein
MLKYFLAFLALNAFVVSTIIYEQSADERQQFAQERIMQRATDAVGMPEMENFEERRAMRQVLEARDRPTPTIVYLVSGNSLSKLCDALGYGIQAGTQFTNSAQPTASGLIMPQAEPNALFSPPTSEGTWVRCLEPTSKQARVVYVQSRIVISPFPLSNS